MLEFPPIKDIAPPIEPAATAALPWLWWLGAAILALLLLTGLFLALRAAARRWSLPALPLPPENQALRDLDALRHRAPSLSPENFAAQLSHILRTFLHRHSGILAHFATSPEILGDRPSPSLPPPPPAVAAFRAVLHASDTLKFGPPSPSDPASSTALLDAARTAIQAAAAAPIPPPPLPPPLPLSPPSAP